MKQPQLSKSIYLAWRDWKHEGLLSLCAVLALASMLSPILILQGLKNGVTAGMRERLLKDPTALIITPKSDAGRFSPEFVAALARLPGAAYAIGRTRETAADITLQNGDHRASISLEPSTPGEPVLVQYKVTAPTDGKTPELVLSSNAARALAATKGAAITTNLTRRTPEGRLEAVPMTFHVAAILPPEAADRKLAFAPLSLLEDVENYRDNIAVPTRGFSGQPAIAERRYASFRLYAQSLNDVEPLSMLLEKDKIEVITHAREIAAIQALETSVNQIILIISIAVGAGFAAFMLSSSESTTRRKKRMLGMLHLLGFRRIPLMCFPLAQSLFTTICGFLLSLCIYAGVALAIAEAFASRGNLECRIDAVDLGIAFLTIIILSGVATIRSAWQTAALAPSIVIREV